MSRWLIKTLLLASLLMPGIAAAETATFEVLFLPLNEAKEVVKSQLSQSGSFATLPSRRILVINDDARHIEQARQLLKRLDQPAPQYQLYLELLSLSDDQIRSIQTDAQLPGGWIRVALKESEHHLSSRKRFNLRLTSSRQGSVESGTIQPYRQQTKQWLAGYGVIKAHSVELVPITSGFYATARRAGEKRVNIRITPWMQNQRVNEGIRGEIEILVDLGSTHSPRQAPSGNAPVRLNATPVMKQKQAIKIAGAATELTIPVGETIVIAASSEEAALLGDALLSSGSSTGKKSFAIRLRVEKR